MIVDQQNLKIAQFVQRLPHHGYVPRPVRHSVLPNCSSPKSCRYGRAIQHRFNLMKLAVLHFKHLRQSPRSTGCEDPLPRRAVRRLEMARLPRRMIEKDEAEHQPALWIHSHVPPVANPGDEM